MKIILWIEIELAWNQSIVLGYLEEDLKFNFIICVECFTCMNVCAALHACCSQRPQKGIRSSRTEVVFVCELPSGY